MIQTWRILTGKDRVDPANWFIVQGDQVREGVTSTRGHRGYQALLTRPPAKLEVRVLLEQGGGRVQQAAGQGEDGTEHEHV